MFELMSVCWEVGTWLHTFACAYPFLPEPFTKETVSSPLSKFFVFVRDQFAVHAQNSWVLCCYRSPCVIFHTSVTRQWLLHSFRHIWSQALWSLEGLLWFPVNFRIISPHLFLWRKSLVFWRLSLEWFLILWELIYLNEKMCPQISTAGYI